MHVSYKVLCPVPPYFARAPHICQVLEPSARQATLSHKYGLCPFVCIHVHMCSWHNQITPSLSSMADDAQLHRAILEDWYTLSKFVITLQVQRWGADSLLQYCNFATYTVRYMWCDQAKWVWSWQLWFFVFWHFLLGYWLGFNLVKTPQKLGNRFQRYKQLKDWTNNKKQKKLSALFGCILKTVFVSSNSFCLITSHITISIFWSAYIAIWSSYNCKDCL